MNIKSFLLLAFNQTVDFKERNSNKVKILANTFMLSVILFACCTTGCNNKEGLKSSFFADYSLSKAEGIGMLSEKDIESRFKNRTYFFVKYPDSSYQEIFPRNVKLDYVKKIKVYKNNGLSVYHVYFTHPRPMARDDLYWAYEDSTLKEYAFIGNSGSTDLILTAYSHYVNDSCTVYWILVKDTSNFTGRIWEFDKASFEASPDDDTLKTLAKIPYTLEAWLRKREVYN